MRSPSAADGQQARRAALPALSQFLQVMVPASTGEIYRRLSRAANACAARTEFARLMPPTMLLHPVPEVAREHLAERVWLKSQNKTSDPDDSDDNASFITRASSASLASSAAGNDHGKPLVSRAEILPT